MSGVNALLPVKEDLMLIANDLGYGFIKADINGERVKIPSAIATKQSYMAPNPDTISDKYMENFLDNMDVSISSSSVNRTGRFLIGRAASKAASRTQTFNIYSGKGKSDDDLSVILTLSMIAGQRVKLAYEANADLSKPLNADVIMATELPISEGRNSQVSKNYEDKYLGHKHIVTFNNFNDPITVSINFISVRSYLEGETASLALANAAKGLKGFKILDSLREAVAKDYKKNYPERAKKYGVEEILNALNIFILDIGERTSDLVTTTLGAANPEASDSIDLGFGTALERTRQELRVRHLANFNSRYDLKEYLHRDLVGANKEKQEQIRQILIEQLQPLSDGIIDASSNILSLTANDTDVVFVLGGGSIPMLKQSNLRRDLVELLQSLGSEAPVIGVDSKFAQWMNEIGLLIALSVMVQEAKDSGVIE